MINLGLKIPQPLPLSLGAQHCETFAPARATKGVISVALVAHSPWKAMPRFLAYTSNPASSSQPSQSQRTQMVWQTFRWSLSISAAFLISNGDCGIAPVMPLFDTAAFLKFLVPCNPSRIENPPPHENFRSYERTRLGEKWYLLRSVRLSFRPLLRSNNVKSLHRRRMGLCWQFARRVVLCRTNACRRLAG